MSNIIVSPTSGVIEFNTGDASGSAFHTSTAPIRLDATGGNTFFTGTNIGIGTSTPTGLLDINGVSYFRGGTTVGHVQNESDAPIIIEDNNYIHSQNAGTYLRRLIGKTSAGAIEIGESSTSIINAIRFYAGSSANTSYTFYSGATELVRIDASGNVGIGTNVATPQYDKTLHIEGANPTVRLETTYSAGWAYSQYVSPQTTWSVGIDNNDKYIIANSATLSSNVKFVVDDANGFVGIGSTSPQTILDVDGAASHGIRIGSNNALIGEGGGTTGTQLIFWNGTSAYYGRSLAPFTHTVSNHYFRVGGSDKMTIGSAGVGIGSISPAFELDVVGTIHGTSGNFENGITIDGNPVSTGAAGGSLTLQQVTDNGATTTNNIGIGTATPRTTLHVSKAGTTEGGIITIANPNTTDGSYCGIEFINSSFDYPRSAIFAMRTGGAYDAELTFHTSPTNEITGTDYPAATERMRIDHDGNVGIGTNNPVSALHVIGDGGDAVQVDDGYLRLRSTANQGALTLTPSTSNESRIAAGKPDLGQAFPLKIAGDYVRFCTSGAGANTEVMRMTADGKVGIGTDNPEFKLQVENTVSAGSDNFILNVRNTTHASDSRAGIAFRMNNNTSTNWDGAGIQAYNNGVDGAGHLGFGSVLNNTFSEHVRITSPGKVGIGTNNPSHTLDVESADETVASFNSTDNKCAIALNDDDTTVYVSAENSRGALGFQAGLHANNLNIDTAGNVGIGTHTTTTPGGTAKLTVQSSTVAFSWGPSASDFVYHRRLSAGKFQIQPYYGGNVGELHLAPYGGNDSPVVIGATSAEAGVKLHVEGVISGSDNAFFDGNITISGNPVITGSGTTSTHIITESEGIGSNNNDFTIPTSAAVKAYVDVAGGGGGGGSVGTLQQVTTLGAETSTAVTLNGGVTVSKNIHPVTLNRTDGSSALINLQTQGGSRGFLGASSTDAFSIFNATPTRLLTVVNDGKVGIGTATPSGNLHVKDATVAGYKSDTYARLITESEDSRIQVVSDNGGNNGSALILTNVNAGTHSNWVFGQTTTSQSNKLHIGHNTSAGGDVSHYSNSNDFTLTTDGKVGIGSFSPAFVLDTVFAGDNGARIKSSDNHSVFTIQSHSSYGGYIRFTDGDNRYWIHNDSNDSLYFRPKGIAPSSNVGVVFDETGKVGIGTSDPNRSLSVVGQIGIDNSTSPSAGMLISLDGNSNKIYSRTANNIASAHPLDFFAGSTHTLRIASNGNVGIGTDNPSQRLNVSGGNIRIDHQDPQLMFNDIGGSTYSSSWMYQNNAIKFVWGGGHKFKIDSAGGVTLGQSYSTSETAPSKGIIAEGRVGLGTTSAAATLYVGDTTNETNGTAIISGTGTSTPAANLYVYGSGNGDVINAVRDRNDASIKVTSTTAGAYFRTNSATPTYNGIDLNTNWFIGQYGYNDLRIVDGTASAGDAAAAVTVQNSTKYVGIGTTNPDAPLHIKSTTNIQTLRINSAWNEGVGAVATISTSANGNVLSLQSATTSDSREIFEVKNSNGTVFEVQGDGKVGIGTQTPSGALHVSSNSTNVFIQDENSSYPTARALINFNDNGTQGIMGSIGYEGGGNGNLTISQRNPSKYIALTGSNVGIGSTTPARKLDVSTNASDTYGIRNSYSSSYYMEMAHNRFNAVGNNYIRFNIDDSTKMTIVDSDYGGGVNGVGIGTVTPSYELEVIGTTKSTYFIGGAYFEENASSSKLKFYKDGTVLVMDEDGELKPCDKENDTLVFGVSKTDFNAPVVLGAEPILVTGPIKVGDYIVTSNKQGHGQAMKEQKLGTIIAQAMENGDGESYNIKAMIRKM